MCVEAGGTRCASGACMPHTNTVALTAAMKAHHVFVPSCSTELAVPTPWRVPPWCVFCLGVEHCVFTLFCLVLGYLYCFVFFRHRHIHATTRKGGHKAPSDTK